MWTIPQGLLENLRTIKNRFHKYRNKGYRVKSNGAFCLSHSENQTQVDGGICKDEKLCVMEWYNNKPYKKLKDNYTLLLWH